MCISNDMFEMLRSVGRQILVLFFYFVFKYVIAKPFSDYGDNHNK